METVLVAPETLVGKLGSKKVLYNHCRLTLEMYLPPYYKTPMSFIRQLLAKKKKALKENQRNCIDVPKFNELSTVKVWQKIKDIDEISEYFPDLKEGELPDRNYMWNVLNTLKPNSTKSIVKAALKNKSIENEGDSDNMIEIAPEYLEKLLSIGIQKNARGKSAYFLRKSAKLKRDKKPPKAFGTNYNMFRHEEISVLYNGGQINSENAKPEEEEKSMNVDRSPVRRYRGKKLLYPELVESQLDRFYDTYSL